jgi:predicted ester cyclase
MTTATDIEAAVTAYAAFYEGLSPDTVKRLDALCAPDVRFRDPFNDVTGVAAYRAILTRMFEDITEPRFGVKDWALSGRVAYLRWNFTFTTRKGVPWQIEGMSEVHFDDKGRVVAHLDHWDSGGQFFARLPLLGGLINLIRRKLSIES